MLNVRRAGSVIAAALAVSLASIGSGDAAGTSKTKSTSTVKTAKPPAVKSGKASAVKGKVVRKGQVAASAKSAGKGAGSCGTYMYWKGGKCMDGRAKK